MATSKIIRLGVSACLLGEETRYDGGHSRDPYIATTLAEACELISVCPEAELGMGTPRETVDLIGDIDQPRMVTTHTGIDWTEQMNRWCRRRARELESLGLCGYVFKRNSPSCGVHRVKVHQESGRIRRRGRGLFAAEFSRRFPLVPLAEEVRLQDARARDNFVVRIFALQRLRAAFAGRWRATEIMAFHERETALLQAHHRAGWRQLAQLVARLADVPRGEFRDQYQALFMSCLARTATPHKTGLVLRRLARLLPSGIRAGVVAECEAYVHGRAPLLGPLALLQYQGREYGIPELLASSFINPDPRELALRFHA